MCGKKIDAIITNYVLCKKIIYKTHYTTVYPHGILIYNKYKVLIKNIIK